MAILKNGLGVDEYLAAATRDNTRRSYQSAVRHFEVEWGGFLPATADSMTRYLVDHASSLSVATLRQRLAAIAQWHIDQGFPDPTKAPLVKKVLKGIQELHPAQQKQAKPFLVEQLEQLDAWLSQQIAVATGNNNQTALLKYTRDRALVLLGFWRGFRSDELGRLQIENIEAIPNQGMRLFLPRTKGDRSGNGVSFKAPALARLCPVAAYCAWIETAALTTGAVFRPIDRWGRVGAEGLHPNSFIPLLRGLFRDAGIALPDSYSSHSLRRGFANWANANQWDIKTLMEYVGWKDAKSAMRYIEAGDPFAHQRIEPAIHPPSTSRSSVLIEVGAAEAELPTTRRTEVDVHFSLEPQHAKVRGKEQARKAIEMCCLKNHGMQLLDRAGCRYRLFIAHDTDDELNEITDALIDEMHQIAATHSFIIDAQLSDPVSDRVWT